MKKPPSKQIPRTLDLRDRLKSIVESELDSLPQRLEYLTDMKRLHVVLRLLPLVMPKSKPVHYSENEPGSWSSFI